MENSKIYDLLGDKLLHEWRDEVEKEESKSVIFERANSTFDELRNQLDEKNKKLLAAYSIAIENKMDYLYYNIKIKILNFGIKIGMELQKAFAEFE